MRAGHVCTTISLLAVLMAAMPVAAQVATDPEGDAVHRTLAGDVAQAPAAADLLALEVADEGDDLAWTVQTAGPAQGGLDEVDTLVAFRHGSLVYHVVASESVELWISDEAGVAQRWVAQLEGGREGEELRFRLPKELVRDEAGTPLTDGSSLTSITVTTAARDDVQGPDPEQGFFCCTAWWTVHDRMPDEGAAAYRLSAAGTASGVRLWSDAPLRASNGGGDRFVYSLTAAAGADAAGDLSFSEVPEDWDVTGPEGRLDLQAGETHTFPVVVQTPSGHRHGGTQSFLVHLGSGSARIGVHFLDVPQPAGHHPQLFFHSQAVEGGVIEAGYAPGRLWMNTLQDDPLDDGAAVDSTQSSFGGQAASWSICLAEGLRLGLDLAGRLGEMEIALSAPRPYGDVQVSGALYHYAPGPAQPCDAAAYRAERNETLVASIPQTDAQQVQGSTGFSAPVVGEVERIPYQQGAMLLLEITATFTLPDSQAPGPMVLEPGGFVRLPLDEYRDAASVEIPVWQQEPAEVHAEPEAPREGEDAPAGLLVVAAILGASWCRRTGRL